MEAKLLCVGDMHLGRRPSHIPSDLGLDTATLTPAAAWRRVIELALRERVDAVLLAGDVVESANRYFEAFSVLASGIRELGAAGIQVVAVAGNHDVEVLPRLADEIEGFHLLGRGGRWEAHDIVRAGRTLARVVGWSFPERVVERSPFESFELPLDRELPLIGLLHCDLDTTPSRYAPVALRDLERQPIDIWLLGHVHKPSLVAGERPIGYLGSLQGLDPSERGARGPWMLHVGGSARLAIEHIPLAPLRWEEIDVSVDDLDAPDDVHSRIVRAISERHAIERGKSFNAVAVGCRVRLVGRTRHSVALRRFCALDQAEALRQIHDGATYFVDRVTNVTEPMLDLAALAEHGDPPGLLARRLLALQREPLDSDAKVLTHTATSPLQRVAEQAVWQSLGTLDLGEAAVRARLIRVGTRALEDLLAQSEPRA